MDRLSPNKVILPLLLLLALASPARSADERKSEMQRGPTKNPHGALLKTPCGSCHTSTSWSPIRTIPEFDHNRETKFPLRGMHEKVQCALCHTKLVFTDVGTKCADCHADIHRRQFGAQCEDCHTVRGWQDGVKSIREHSARFPLIGAHATVTCDSCHVSAAVGRFVGLSTQCASCHINDFNTATSVNHRAAGFSVTCETCHTMNTWRGAIFDHSQTGFTLAGAHARLDCATCHIGGRFKGTSADCFSCHVKDFNATSNPPHAAAGFPKDCSVCHGTVDWNNAKFDHNITQFPLTGAHVAVTCNACHIGGRFTATPMACYSCHVNEFNATTNPNHRTAGLPTDCSQCHTTANWQNAKFDHSLTKFPLTGAHATVACATCHVGGQFSNTASTCIGCHLADVNKTTNPNHIAAAFPQDCAVCHTTVNWDGAKFDHNTATKFALTGAHIPLQCAQCHINNKFAGTSMQCVGCHMPDFNKAMTPNHVASGFPQACESCHTTAAWQPANFDHAKTAFPLTGAHTTTQCQLCHVNNNFTTAPTQCSGCHMTDFKKTTSPNHVAASLPQDCVLCHTTANWNGAKFDHNTATKFPLTGSHIQLQCAQCHINNVFAGTPAQCAGCHMPDFNKATNPNHVKSGFPQDCQVCHGTTAWQPAAFDHSKTSFPLTGAHIATQCLLCHVNNNFATVPVQCAGCHLPDFNKTTNPNHVKSGFPQDCQVCHGTTAWQPASFDHSKSAFPLTGAHVATQCALCHVNNNFTTVTTQCSGCHLTDFKKTTNPNHAAAGFPTDCAACHTTVNWAGGKFNHSTATKFPLTGAHIPVPCAQCHINNKFAGTSTQCVGCHLADYKKTTSPNHVAAGYPQTCETCHTTAAWQSATFDHAKTIFPLTGAHSNTQCVLCHVNNNFKTLPTQCSGCHLNDFNKTTNPNHAAAGFPQDCASCHSTVNWLGAKFNHNTATKFPLTGAHIPLQCAQCHIKNVFAATPTACSGCHLPDFNKTTNPNHVTGGFPQACQTCHTTAAWQPATFDHNKTGFPLTGTHLTTVCALCHVNNNYNLTSPACATCHLGTYNTTTNPNHKAAGFPTDCSTCHSTVNWAGAKFNHNTATKFPLTGAHIPLQCAQCHINNVFAATPTACSGCHLTDFNKTTNPNHVTGGFPQACETCHTTAAWQPASFDHSKTGFTLTGTHITTACAQCHINNNYKLTSPACATCHLNTYNTTTNPNHKTAGFATDCSLCHSTVDWSGAKFDHSKSGFPLTGTHLTTACALCHVNNNYNLTSPACATCHMDSFNKATNPNHVAAAFPTDCSLCHSTVNWTSATFNHANTGFPLTGKHTTTACALCHVNNNYNLTSPACATCHLNTYNTTTNPNHKTAGFATDCSLCHSTVDWSGAKFDHSKSGFPLTGTHLTTACALCHVNNNYNLTSPACATCHIDSFNKTTNPNHVAAAFPTDCSLCHSTVNWTSSTFNHANTGFPLTGKHTTTVCALCHVSNNYTLTSGACYPCHTKDYNGTNNPPHAASGMPQDCSLCHSTSNWDGAVFDHTKTGFALTGTHLTTACLACHVNNNYKLTSGACYPCHTTDFNGTNNPPHVASGFPQDCSLCHSTTNWNGAVFDHSTTGFALTGTHSTTACAACHVNNNYKLTSAACANCHLATYQATTNPNHVSAGFPTTCNTCHNFNNWAGAVFNHPTTPFALTGAHITVACASCHIGNVFVGTPTDCYSCHKADYTGTNNPAHVAAGFPTTCATCHTTTQWTGATFNHTWFPITNGNHKQPCAVCHINSADYSVFSCTATCHAKASTDNKHSGVKNYVYNSTSCYGCHRNGGGG